ncbi:MAG TPA: prolyl oligopeptidase family serine peptidase [Vicinamibacterales bacterium]|nr:prolyl oligopeptidase family serine peptidase [Vicinamibacterales bacterium]
MIGRAFDRWERSLASVDTNRVARPFEWGLDWVALGPDDEAPLARLTGWADATVRASDAFFRETADPGFDRQGESVRFASALQTPYPENNTVTIRVFEPAPKDAAGKPRRAVVVLPQWNADREGHVGLCRLFAKFGLTAARLSLPYHDERRPPALERSEYIVSSNVGRTLHANRQAVLDARRAVDWLEAQGYERIGIMGTSLGSCLAMLTMAHDPRIVAGAFNHVSPYFADVVWRGISTSHVRDGLEGHVTLDEIRACWMPISPWPFIDRIKGRPALLVYALWDLTFPVDLSRMFIAEFRRRGVPHETAILPCGHYTTGRAPFKFLDGYYLTRFLATRL